MSVALNTLVDTRTGRAIDLAMQRLEVTGRVYPLGSFVRVTHRFKCLGTQPMEAIYVSALPTNGTLRRFRVVGENFEVESKLEPRKQARKTYEEGLQDGHLSVLAETNQDGLVHLSVGQVQPDEEVSVIMDVVVGVTTKDTGFSFRYPFTLAPNYHGSARMVPTEGGGRIELPGDVFGDMTLPEWKTAAFGLHEVSFRLLVHGGTNLTAVSSPSHRIAVAPQPDGAVLVSLAGMGDTPNRDLVLDVSVPEASTLLFADATLLGSPPTGDEPQIPKDAARWTALIPSTSFTRAQKQPRRLCFVIDRSGSMSGQPIVQAKRALLACLSSLTPEDEFGIVHFGSDAKPFHPSLVKADDANRKKAQAWVDSIHCAGGTEMLAALATATRVLGGPGDVYILTDGEVFQTGPLVEHMAASQSRVHVLGIGTASQHRFMAQLARRTGGVCDMVSPQEDVGLAGLKLFNQVKDPVITKASAKVDGKDVPYLGTVWEGLPLLVTDPNGNGSLPGTILVDGQAPIQNFVQVPVPDGLTALLWASRRIEDLSSKQDMVAEGTPKRDQIERQMTDLSVSYGLASRVMSLVAVVARIGDQAGTTPEQKIVAVGLPEGMENVFDAYSPQINVQSLNLPGRRSVTRSVSKGADLSLYASSISDTLGFMPDMERGGMQPVSYMATRGARSLLSVSADAGYRPPGVFLANMYQESGSTGSPHVAPAAGPAVSADDPNDWSYTGNLLVDIGTLRADGGVPGHGLDDRVLHTMLLALIVAQAAVKTPGVYDIHLDRMVKFIQDKGPVLNDEILLHKVVKAIQNKSCAISVGDLKSFFYKKQKDTFQILRTQL